jgi:hypothetical protein
LVLDSSFFASWRRFPLAIRLVFSHTQDAAVILKTAAPCVEVTDVPGPASQLIRRTTDSAFVETISLKLRGEKVDTAIAEAESRLCAGALGWVPRGFAG